MRAFPDRLASAMKRMHLGLAAALLAASASVSGRAPAATRLPVANPGFEQAASGTAIPGWNISQHAGVQAFEMRVDTAAAAEGHASFRMQRLHEQVYGLVTQTVDVAQYAGKTLELSAKVKTADVGPGGWTLYLDSAGARESAKATGTDNWRTLKVRLKLAPQARTAEIGGMLLDRGTAWLDDVKLMVIEP
jgi:hypothetical protein